MDEELLNGKTFLVVDDETDLREIVASELEFMGAEVHQAENVSVAKSFLHQNKIDLIVSDIRMPGGTGIDLLDYVKSQNPCLPPMILITGFADITIEDAFRKGAEALMNKPFKLDDLIALGTRLTRPLSERFVNPNLAPGKKLELKFDSDLNTKISRKEWELGRGGVCLKFDSKGRRVDMNEELAFSFSFLDIEIKGVGMIRWQRHTDQGHQVTLGFEFLHLDPASLKYCEEVWKIPRIPFIPIL